VLKTPELLVWTERISPLASLDTTTLPFGTADPEGSVTVPEMPATPPACAKALPATKSAIIIPAETFRIDSPLFFEA
jgi:hypothetical protein